MLSGAEPQMSALMLVPIIFFRIVGKTSLVAIASQTKSAILPRPSCLRMYADFPRKLRQVGIHEDRTSAEQAGECRYPGSGEIQRRPLIDTVLACLIGSGVHQSVEALGGALQDMSYITRSDYYAFGFAGSAGGVDDCHQVGVGVWYLFVWLGHSLRQAQGRLCPSSCRPCLIRSKDLLEQRLRWSLRPALQNPVAQRRVAATDQCRRAIFHH